MVELDKFSSEAFRFVGYFDREAVKRVMTRKPEEQTEEDIEKVKTLNFYCGSMLDVNSSNLATLSRVTVEMSLLDSMGGLEDHDALNINLLSKELAEEIEELREFTGELSFTIHEYELYKAKVA